MKHYDIVNDFSNFLLQVAGVRENTKHQYLRYVQKFLCETFDHPSKEQLAELAPVDVIQYIMNQKRIYGIPTLKAMTNALRSFFRFLEFKGLCDDRIKSAVPAIANWKLAHIPQYLTKNQIEMLLSSFDRKKANGLRGYAIALCLSRLGLRQSEVANLTLDNIEWQSGTIQLPENKGRWTNELPLPEDVGEAIVAYLKRGRPATTERKVFVRHCFPVGTAVTGSAIGAVIRRAFRRLSNRQINARFAKWKEVSGIRHELTPHSFRSGFADRLYKTTKDLLLVLGHRDIRVTGRYLQKSALYMEEAIEKAFREPAATGYYAAERE